MTSKYRPEIDGLRAVAIIPVVLYHAGVPWLSGGYVGVDVFFVISGYLITGILASQLSENRFSILEFYERRIRRIFPALFSVLGASGLLALWLLLPHELDDFAKSLFASTLFLSNFYFMGDTGYFAGPAESKPLLHIWSLAVEEQFYIFFPVYLFVMFRYLRRWLLPCSLVLALLSFVLCVAATSKAPDFAFFSSPTRAWELLAGAFLALVPRRTALPDWVAQSLGAAGLAMIAFAVVTFSESTAFPGAAALLPVVGTALIIYATSANRTWTGELLSVKSVRFVGLISYSLYLWHWPLLVFYRFWRVDHPAPWEMGLVVFVAVCLSAISWHYIERPFRTRELLPTRPRVFAAGGAVMAVVLGCAAVAALLDGFAGRFPSSVHTILAARDDFKRPSDCDDATSETDFALPICTIGDKSADAATFVLWGDSHAMALHPAFDAVGQESGRQGLFVGYNGCVPLIGVDQIRRGFDTCSQKNDAILKYIASRPGIRTVFMVSRWSIYAMGDRFLNEAGQTVFIRDDRTTTHSRAENQAVFERGLDRTIDALVDLGLEVIIVSQVPETEFDIPTAMARAEWLNHAVDLRPSVQDYRLRQAFVTQLFRDAAANPAVSFLNLGDSFCPSGHCIVSVDQRPIYRDSSHVTAGFARSLGPRLQTEVGEKMAQTDDAPQNPSVH